MASFHSGVFFLPQPPFTLTTHSQRTCPPTHNAHIGPQFPLLKPLHMLRKYHTYHFLFCYKDNTYMILIKVKQPRRAQSEKGKVAPTHTTNPHSPEITTFLGMSSRNLYLQSRIKTCFNKNEVSEYILICTLL